MRAGTSSSTYCLLIIWNLWIVLNFNTVCCNCICLRSEEFQCSAVAAANWNVEMRTSQSGPGRAACWCWASSGSKLSPGIPRHLTSHLASPFSPHPAASDFTGRNINIEPSQDFPSPTQEAVRRCQLQFQQAEPCVMQGACRTASLQERRDSWGVSQYLSALLPG